MIYLDNNATTTIDPCVLEAMGRINNTVGNPSSIHRYGQKARGLLAYARKALASYFKVQPGELIFTSGATEALNMVIRSCPKASHIITSSVEHISVMESVKLSECRVTYLDPEPGQGATSVDQIQKALRPDTKMIVLMAANNETGIKTDLETIATLAHTLDISLVVDGVALLGKEPVSIPEGVSAICFSGHKIHGPTGIGLAIVKKRFKLHPLIVGGPQQFAKRGGTEHLAGIVGLTKAIELIDEESQKRMKILRDRLEEGITSRLSDVIIHGLNQPRVCNTSNIAFLGIDGEMLLMQLDLKGVAVSHGAACSSGNLEPSYVLLNMGLPMDIARVSIRFSLSRFTTEKEIDQTIEIVTRLAAQLKTDRYIDNNARERKIRTRGLA